MERFTICKIDISRKIERNCSCCVFFLSFLRSYFIFSSILFHWLYIIRDRPGHVMQCSLIGETRNIKKQSEKHTRVSMDGIESYSYYKSIFKDSTTDSFFSLFIWRKKQPHTIHFFVNHSMDLVFHHCDGGGGACSSSFCTSFGASLISSPASSWS